MVAASPHGTGDQSRSATLNAPQMLNVQVWAAGNGQAVIMGVNHKLDPNDIPKVVISGWLLLNDSALVAITSPQRHFIHLKS